MFDQEHFAMG